MTALLLLSTFLLLACTETVPEHEAVAGDTVSAPTAELPAQRSDTDFEVEAADSATAQWRERIPHSFLIRRGACPFECCVYREWTPGVEIQLVSGPRRTADPTSSVSAGEPFTADSGRVYITGLAVAAVHDTTDVYPDQTLVPGDTVVLLDHVGEGHYNVWRGGEVLQVESFWEDWRTPTTGELLGEYASEWWVHATTSAGERGWFRADRPELEIRGADACGV